ncbi:MAG: putative metal-binding motif-containing protein [Candidatus Nomurabacteria bacterium]|nr:MAG: putative metal-binding motif-containing protein [Candidatus Nomurabacteria bacterium]
MRNFNLLKVAMMATLGLVLVQAGCASPFDASDSHAALTGTCDSTGNQPGDINYCPNTCPPGYSPQATQYCDPANNTWTECTCVAPVPSNPDGGVNSTDGRFCTIGGPGGPLGWQYQLSPGVYTICVQTDIPLGCVVSNVGVMGEPCTNGVGECTQAGTFTCDKPTATLFCNATPLAPQAETCNGLDDDCDGTPDSTPSGALICSQQTCYVDADGDGFGTGDGVLANNGAACGAGMATVPGDCDDTVSSTFPGAPEICDLPTGIDNDCDGQINEGLSCESIDCYEDVDDDGFGYGLPVTRLGTSCNAGESAVPNDCAPNDPAVHPGATEICNLIDDNCDGMIDGGNTCESVRCFPDADGDGFGTGVGVVRIGTTCLAGEVKLGGECNDANDQIHPGATEICNGFDDNCDGTIDDMLVCMATTCYTDGDMDGFGSGVGMVMPNTTQCPSGTSAIFGDCNDASSAVFPGAIEICNTIDDDCTLVADDGLTCNMVFCYVDADGDGHGAGVANPINGTAAAPAVCPDGQVGLDDDCDDGDDTIHPGAIEMCNLIDDDCDLTIDDGLSCEVITCYADTDGDGYGAGAPNSLAALACPAGQVTVAGDCNNNVNTIHPNAVEVCGDAIDQNCNTIVDDGCIITSCFVDADNDGFGTGTALQVYGSCPAGRVTNNSDCNDANASQNPLQLEVCDMIDNDCDGMVNENLSCVSVTCYTDADADGYGVGAGFVYSAAMCPAGTSSANGDCNDAAPTTHPNAAELCGDQVDNDCDALVNEGCVTTNCYADTDNDGYGAGAVNVVSGAVCPSGQVSNNNDCSPSNASVNPGATEVCGDLLDNNCSGVVNEGCPSGTTTVSATLNTSNATRVFVLTGSDTNGVPCTAQPTVVDATTLSVVPGSSCAVSGGNTVVSCSGVPTGVPWTIRSCVNVNGTVYIVHMAHNYGGTCVASTSGYSDYASITAGNGSPITGTTSSGVCRNGAL